MLSQLMANPSARLQEIGLVSGERAYDADLGPGTLAKYHYATTGRRFFITERPVLASHEPFLFIYPQHVSATPVTMAGGTAMIVRHDPKFSASFAHWTDGDRLITVMFGWPVSQADAETLVRSVVVTA